MPERVATTILITELLLAAPVVLAQAWETVHLPAPIQMGLTRTLREGRPAREDPVEQALETREAERVERALLHPLVPLLEVPEVKAGEVPVRPAAQALHHLPDLMVLQAIRTTIQVAPNQPPLRNPRTSRNVPNEKSSPDMKTKRSAISTPTI